MVSVERLRALTSAQRFALVLLGTVVANIGRVVLDGLPRTVVITLGFAMVLIALGLIELTVWGFHAVKQQRDVDHQVTEV